MNTAKVIALSERFGIRMEILQQTSSTNDVAHDANYGHGDVVFALRQTAGRGQRGNAWESHPGENLTFSLVLKPFFLPAENQFLLSECIALALVDTLAHYNIEAQIKWTNDIYVKGCKICGILIENDICGANLSRSIVGIGLNVNQREFSRLLPNPTSIANESGKELDLCEVFERFYTMLIDRFEMLADEEYEKMSADYHAKLYRLNERHLYYLPDQTPIYGIIRSVSYMGELMVEHDNGTTKGYLFKEIEFSLPPKL